MKQCPKCDTTYTWFQYVCPKCKCKTQEVFGEKFGCPESTVSTGNLEEEK